MSSALASWVLLVWWELQEPEKVPQWLQHFLEKHPSQEVQSPDGPNKPEDVFDEAQSPEDDDEDLTPDEEGGSDTENAQPTAETLITPHLLQAHITCYKLELPLYVTLEFGTNFLKEGVM